MLKIARRGRVGDVLSGRGRCWKIEGEGIGEGWELYDLEGGSAVDLRGARVV